MYFMRTDYERITIDSKVYVVTKLDGFWPELSSIKSNGEISLNHRNAYYWKDYKAGKKDSPFQRLIMHLDKWASALSDIIEKFSSPQCLFHDAQEYTCKCSGEVAERHRNTAYHYTDEDKAAGKPNPNLMVSCEAHYQMDYDYYQERWDEYWSSRLQASWCESILEIKGNRIEKVSRNKDDGQVYSL